MGLLSEGEPLNWEETKKLADHVRKHGIKQFITQYKKLKERKKDVLYWGDEVSCFYTYLRKLPHIVLVQSISDVGLVKKY